MKTEKTLTDLEIIEKEIQEYVQKNEVSPFARVEIGEDGVSLEVDMDQEFETKITKQVEDINESLGEYFTNLLKEMVEKIDSGELNPEDLKDQEDIDDISNLEDTPQGIPEAP